MSAQTVQPLTLDTLLARCVEEGASDLHLSGGEPPRLRVHGALRTRDDLPPLSPERVDALARSVMSSVQSAAYDADGALDMALDAGGARFRLNAFRERGQTSLAVRRLDDTIRSLALLGLPSFLERLTTLDEGLVLFTGPTGSGKSTSLATLIDAINRARPCHVLTLEDPIEYVHRSRTALVRQREMHADFTSFAQALRSALREDPDVILVGEMRDTETMRAALQAAETGHLVFSTLHAGSAVGTTERLIGAFPATERDSIRQQLSMVLRAVVLQRLLPLASGDGRTPIVEFLWVTNAVANLIRGAKAAQIYAAMEGHAQGAHQQGSQTLEQSLAQAVHERRIDLGLAERTANQPAAFQARLRALRGRPTTRSLSR